MPSLAAGILPSTALDVLWTSIARDSGCILQGTRIGRGALIPQKSTEKFWV
jgi:hypothetical protein